MTCRVSQGSAVLKLSFGTVSVPYFSQYRRIGIGIGIGSVFSSPIPPIPNKFQIGLTIYKLLVWLWPWPWPNWVENDLCSSLYYSYFYYYYYSYVLKCFSLYLHWGPQTWYTTQAHILDQFLKGDVASRRRGTWLFCIICTFSSWFPLTLSWHCGLQTSYTPGTHDTFWSKLRKGVWHLVGFHLTAGTSNFIYHSPNCSGQEKLTQWLSRSVS